MMVCILVSRVEKLLSILVASVICLHSSMQAGYIIEHTNVKCHLCAL